MKLEYQIIKRKDNFCIEISQLLDLLQTNQNYTIDRKKSTIVYKKVSIKYEIKRVLNNSNTEIMFIITFLLDDDNELDIFEKFDQSFVNFITKFTNDFNLNRLWDDISKKYSEDMYSKISNVENLLRKIIYYFMGKNVGSAWTERCFPKIVGDSIQGVKDKNNTKNNENILYYADFIQLNYLLFIKYPNKLIPQNELIEKLKDNSINIKEIIQNYEYKSNWDRYFQPIVNKENLEENISKLYYYRCLVAHNRLIRENDKKATDDLVNKVEKILQKCLIKIDDVNVPEEDKKNLEEMSTKILNSNISNEINYKSITDSLKINSGISNIQSVADSMKGISEINLGISSAIDSVKGAYRINPAIMSVADSMKGISGINLGITSVMEPINDACRINPAIMSVADSMKGISSINIGSSSQIDSILDDYKINPTIPFSTEPLKETINNSALLGSSIEKSSNIKKENKINKKAFQENKKD